MMGIAGDILRQRLGTTLRWKECHEREASAAAKKAETQLELVAAASAEIAELIAAIRDLEGPNANVTPTAAEDARYIGDLEPPKPYTFVG